MALELAAAEDFLERSFTETVLHMATEVEGAEQPLMLSDTATSGTLDEFFEKLLERLNLALANLNEVVHSEVEISSAAARFCDSTRSSHAFLLAATYAWREAKPWRAKFSEIFEAGAKRIDESLTLTTSESSCVQYRDSIRRRIGNLDRSIDEIGLLFPEFQMLRYGVEKTDYVVRRLEEAGQLGQSAKIPDLIEALLLRGEFAKLKAILDPKDPWPAQAREAATNVIFACESLLGVQSAEKDKSVSEVTLSFFVLAIELQNLAVEAEKEEGPALLGVQSLQLQVFFLVERLNRITRDLSGESATYLEEIADRIRASVEAPLGYLARKARSLTPAQSDEIEYQILKEVSFDIASDLRTLARCALYFAMTRRYWESAGDRVYVGKIQAIDVGEEESLAHWTMSREVNGQIETLEGDRPMEEFRRHGIPVEVGAYFRCAVLSGEINRSATRIALLQQRPRELSNQDRAEFESELEKAFGA